MGKKEKIRVIALAILRCHDHLFVTEYIHPTTGKPYYRPLGGGVDFYETGEDAVRRELMEEIEAPLMNVRYLSTLENIFTDAEGRRHQICLLYEAAFAESERQILDYTVIGQEGSEAFQAMWKPLSMFRNGDAPLYPNGLLDLLDRMVTEIQ
jgi:ADP-ribose pyrophosphatase YjhB (NUDIX family)